jgi:hypothetical protein
MSWVGLCIGVIAIRRKAGFHELLEDPKKRDGSGIVGLARIEAPTSKTNP